MLFAVLIFCLSARDAEESTEDSYAVGMAFGRLTQRDFSDWTEEKQIEFAASVDHPIRKTAHATEYAVFAILLCGVFYDRRRRKRVMAVVAWGIASAYAVTDEFHQLFVPGRSAQVKDVMIDSCGAAVGIAVCAAVLSIAQHIRRRKSKA